MKKEVVTVGMEALYRPNCIAAPSVKQTRLDHSWMLSLLALEVSPPLWCDITPSKDKSDPCWIIFNCFCYRREQHSPFPLPPGCASSRTTICRLPECFIHHLITHPSWLHREFLDQKHRRPWINSNVIHYFMFPINEAARLLIWWNGLYELSSTIFQEPPDDIATSQKIVKLGSEPVFQIRHWSPGI